jgi:gas vesicle protein GvpK
MAMLDLEEKNLATGLLALVIALLEVIKEALVHAALSRVEGGRLSDSEVERLGDALAELDDAVSQLKVEHGIEEAVQSVRHDLDQVVGGLIGTVAGRRPVTGEVEPPHARQA